MRPLAFRLHPTGADGLYDTPERVSRLLADRDVASDTDADVRLALAQVAGAIVADPERVFDALAEDADPMPRSCSDRQSPSAALLR